MKNEFAILNAFYGDLRGLLERQFHKTAENVGLTASELIGDAFSYVCGGVLSRKVRNPDTVEDLKRLIALKANRLAKDAWRSNSRVHGRRSVCAGGRLDSVLEDGRQTLADSASMMMYRNALHEREDERRRVLARRTLKEVLGTMRIPARNKRIFTECFFDGVPGEVMARKYNTTRDNVYVIVSRVLKRLGKSGPEVFKSLDRAA